MIGARALPVLQGFSVLASGVALGSSACERERSSPAAAATVASVPQPIASFSASPSASAPAPVVDAAPEVEPEPKSESCPEGMVLVEGKLCPGAVQQCLEHHPEYLRDKSTSERCLEYKSPSKCISKERKTFRFCMDRYEWPNKKGEMPLVLVQWLEAKKHCESVGKRLCDEEEWLFACEGEEMLPYVYGYKRDDKKCQIDRPYVPRKKALKRYEGCQKDPECKERFDKLDQRKPIGSFPECISPEGVYDLNGSVNEWVNIPGKKYPNRSGLKGGWWGPVRCRCRPTVTFHKEEDWGYEAGFRCCKDADADSADAGAE